MYPLYIKFLLQFYYYFEENYEVARRKLRQAEEISDLNTSGTEQEEVQKKSRKIRAARDLDVRGALLIF